MSSWEGLVERRIREAMEQGEFEDLPGEGRPLDLGVNPFEDPEMALAHRMLRNAGMAPAWIEERRDITGAIARLRERATRGMGAEELASEIARLNARILSHNVKAPSAVWGLPQLSLEAELGQG